MTGPGAPADLRLSPELATADLAAIRRRAVEHLGDAAAAREQADALRRAVVRLVPAAWLGLGSLSFATAALVQAEALEAVAAAGAELGAALQALAASLELARQRAEDAVRAGHRLDAEVVAMHAAWGRGPEPERAVVGPARLDAVTDESRRTAGLLAAAEEAARVAWRRAGAAFDLVAYRMPDLARRMRGDGAGGAGDPGDGWRPSTALATLPPAAWRSLVGVSPVCVDAGWSGGGALAGPDGRQYPLVVPWIARDGHRYTADADGSTAPGPVETLGGVDTGWHEIGTRVGIDEFGPRAATVDKAAIIIAGLAGKAPQTVGRLRPELLGRLTLGPDGVARLDDVPAGGRGAQPGTGQIPRGAFVPTQDGGVRWVGDTAAPGATDTRAVRRGLVGEPPMGRAVPVGPNVVGLADQTLSAAGTAGRLDDSRSAGYRVVFEENDDGRRRARLSLYQVRSDDDGTSVLTTDASLTPTGELQRPRVTYLPTG